MMTAWHYSKSGAQHGPIPIDDLKAKISAGELSGTSLVWQVGTKDWSEVRNFSELVGHVPTPPPLPKLVTVVARTRAAMTVFVDSIPILGILAILGIFVAVASPLLDNYAAKDNPGFKKEYKEWFEIVTIGFFVVAIASLYFLQPKSDVCPPSLAWKRFFAKFLDMGIAVLAGSIAVAIFITPPTTFQVYLLVFGGVSLVTWFLFEVPMKGKTLGRMLFGVQLYGYASPNYFLRFIKLYFFGMALGIPVLSTFTQLFAYKRLRETGNTLWDGKEFTVVDKHAGLGKVLLGVLLIGIVYYAPGFVLKTVGKPAMSRNSESQSNPTPTAPLAGGGQDGLLALENQKQIAPMVMDKQVMVHETTAAKGQVSILGDTKHFEAMAASVRALHEAIADRAAPESEFPSIEEKTDWLTKMSLRLETRMPDPSARIEFLKTVYYEAKYAGLDPQLVLALIQTVSDFKKYALSPEGARGYMQVMPIWVKRIGHKDTNLFHLRTNLRYGCTILRHYLDMENGDLFRALGHYNGNVGEAEFPNRVRSAWETEWSFNSEAINQKVDKNYGTEPLLLALEAFTVKLKLDEGAQEHRYFQVVPTLKVLNTHVADNVRGYMPEIRHNILLLLSSRKPSDISTPRGQERLSLDIRNVCNQVLDGPTPMSSKSSKPRVDDAVQAVLFSTFIIQ